MSNVNAFSVFLIKKQFKTHSSILKKSNSLTRYALNKKHNIEGEIYIGREEKYEPNWINFLDEGSNKKIKRVYNYSTRAVLFIKYKNRIFAFTFGYGRFLLKEESYEKDFGLKVTLNSVNPDKLRSIDKAEIQEIVRHSRIQLSQSDRISSFGIDPAQDLLRAATGESPLINFARTLTGHESLHFSSNIGFQKLESICAEILRSYNSKNYKRSFDWVDNMQPVKDKSLIEKLDEKLTTSLSKNDIGKAHLAPPEIFDWDSFDIFAFSNKTNKEFPDLFLSDYIDTLRNPTNLSTHKLKQDSVCVRDKRSGDLQKKWSLYKSIVYECNYKNNKYILALGNWYFIDHTFFKKVKGYIEKVHTYNFIFPNCKYNESEGKYNKRISKDYKNKYILLDQKNIKVENATSPIEPSDLLSVKKEFIHIKKLYSSSTLSHLFSQGRVSAEALLGDSTFRKKLNRKIKTIANTKKNRYLVPEESINPGDYTVVYAIISSKNGALHNVLPFFSMVNMMQATEYLRRIGFKVTKSLIKQS